MNMVAGQETKIHRAMGRGGVIQGALIGALLELVSCYPVKQTYFSPSAPTGITVPNECHQQLGPKGTVNFTLGVMNLSVMMNSESRYLVLTAYEIKQDEVSFGPEPFVITSRQGTQIIFPKDTYEFEYTARLYNRRLLPYEDGIRMHPGRTYQLLFKELPTVEDQFILLMPPLTTGTRRIEVPPITFSKITEWRMDMVVLNC